MRCRIGCRNIKLNWPRIADEGTCATKWLVQTKGTGRSNGRWFKGWRVLPVIRSRVRKSQERKDPAPAELFGAEENDAQLCRNHERVRMLINDTPTLTAWKARPCGSRGTACERDEAPLDSANGHCTTPVIILEEQSIGIECVSVK